MYSAIEKHDKSFLRRRPVFFPSIRSREGAERSDDGVSQLCERSKFA
jgi:hypothetical protein